MSTLPNSKSSFLRAAQGCGALVLAGAMVLPMTPALAQDAAPVAKCAGGECCNSQAGCSGRSGTADVLR